MRVAARVVLVCLIAGAAWWIAVLGAPTLMDTLARVFAPSVLGLAIAGADQYVRKRARKRPFFDRWLFHTVLFSILVLSWVGKNRRAIDVPDSDDSKIEIADRLHAVLSEKVEMGQLAQHEERLLDVYRWAEQHSGRKKAGAYRATASLSEQKIAVLKPLEAALEKAKPDILTRASTYAGLVNLENAASDLERGIKTLDQFNDFLGRAESLTRTAMQKEDADPDLADTVLTSLAAGLPQARREWMEVERVLGAELQILQFLRKTWGDWKYDEQSRTLVFDTESNSKEYDILLLRLNESGLQPDSGTG